MNILIIEDDSALGACIVGSIIERFPEANCEVARSCKVAFSLLDTNEYDAITLDGNLEDGHGKTILEGMTADEIRMTVAYSGEIDFLKKALEAGAMAATKGHSEDLLSGLSKILYKAS